ncbi:hypothetical protein GCM10007086_44370 [Photobacterium aphoticum]|nr:hypothetical protein GCM10007086_44370 [Photobacterium aphoticum]
MLLGVEYLTWHSKSVDGYFISMIDALIASLWWLSSDFYAVCSHVYCDYITYITRFLGLEVTRD